MASQSIVEFYRNAETPLDDWYFRLTLAPHMMNAKDAGIIAAFDWEDIISQVAVRADVMLGIGSAISRRVIKDIPHHSKLVVPAPYVAIIQSPRRPMEYDRYNAIQLLRRFQDMPVLFVVFGADDLGAEALHTGNVHDLRTVNSSPEGLAPAIETLRQRGLIAP